MNRLVKLVTGMMVVILGGCSILRPDPVVITETQYIERQIIHPSLPNPISFHKGTPRVITKETIQDEPDRAVFQCFEWNEGQELGVSLRDVNAYINSILAVTCSYRRELNEDICLRFRGNNED